MIERSQEVGYETVCVSDHGLVAAHLDLGGKCDKASMRPGFLVEAYHGLKTDGFKGQERDQAHLILGALTDEGLKNLWRLVDKTASNFRFVPRTTWEMLDRYSEGIFATSACMSGLVCRGIQDGNLDALNQYLNIFKDNFYIEIHTYPTREQEDLNLALISIARERGIPMIWASDAHVAFPSSYDDHDKYLLMQTGQDIDTDVLDRKMWHPPGLHIQSPDEVSVSLSYLPDGVVQECLRNAYDLSQKMNARLPEIRRHLPMFVPSESPVLEDKTMYLDAAEAMVDLAIQGIVERYGNPSEEVWDQLQSELDIFVSAGLEHYILQVWEIGKFCDQNKIVRGPGRGSASASLVCYALKITDIDPLKYNLYFERFYNAGREKGWPDIDIDFPSKDRERVREFVANRWGRDKVENIGTVMSLKPIMALNKTWKTFKINGDEFSEVRKLVGEVPDINIMGSESIGWANDGSDVKTIYVMDYIQDELDYYLTSLPRHRQDAVRSWLDFVGRMVGRVASYGIHASGVVVSDIPIDEELPRMWSAASKSYATQFPMGDVAKRLFPKDDLLGLRNLDTLADWEAQMLDRGVDIDWTLEANREQPPEMWELLHQGLGVGIFQIEDSPFPLELCRRLKPTTIDEIAVIVALNRPGPIRAGSHERYINRKHRLEEVKYDDPFLEDVLDKTYGVWLYQEQIIAFFNKLGYTKQEADSVRSLLGKKDPEAQRRLYFGQEEWKGRSYVDMAKKAGVKDIEGIWDKLEGFSKYSFNIAHACSYAFIAFRTLFAKYWGPQEYILACIRTNEKEKANYIAEARRMGFTINPPRIDKSNVHISLHEDGEIYLGFSEVKGLTISSSKMLLALRAAYGIQVYVPERLSEILEKENDVWLKSKPSIRWKVSPKTIFKHKQIDLLKAVGAFDEWIERPTTYREQQRIEKELLGTVLTSQSDDILARHQDVISACNHYPDIEVMKSVKLPGVITMVKETTTKQGKPMAFVTMEYGLDTCRFAVFEFDLKLYRHLFSEQNCAIMELRCSERGLTFQKGQRLS